MVRFLRATVSGVLVCWVTLGMTAATGCSSGDDTNLFGPGPDGSSSDSTSNGDGVGPGFADTGADADSMLDGTLAQDGTVSESGAEETSAPDSATADGPIGDGAEGDAGPDVASDALTPDALSVGDADAAPSDGQADVAAEAGADATTDAADSDSGPEDGAADAEESDALGPTAQVLLTRGAACLTCGETCIAPDQDDITCDQLVGDQLTRCLQTVACALSNGCTTDGLDPTCLCGDADASACAVGTPSGPCAAYYEADFPDAGTAAILSDFEDLGNPTGVANQIVACLAYPLDLFGCPVCF
jgi:hypothetical protein